MPLCSRLRQVSCRQRVFPSLPLLSPSPPRRSQAPLPPGPSAPSRGRASPSAASSQPPRLRGRAGSCQRGRAGNRAGNRARNRAEPGWEPGRAAGPAETSSHRVPQPGRWVQVSGQPYGAEGPAVAGGAFPWPLGNHRSLLLIYYCLFWRK